MPCYTRQTTKVELKADNQALLMEGLKVAGFTAREINGAVHFSRANVSGRYENGQLRLDTYQGVATEPIVNEIKRGHSLANVRATARRFGWQLQETNATNMVAMKRSL